MDRSLLFKKKLFLKQQKEKLFDFDKDLLLRFDRKIDEQKERGISSIIAYIKISS